MLPIQRAVMRLLDSHRIRKVLSAELGVSESELSRLSTGSRPLGVDLLVEALRLDLPEHPERVTEALGVLAEALDHRVEYTGLVEELQADDLSSESLDLAAATGAVCSRIREATADRRIDAREEDEILAACERAEHEIAQVRAAVRAARRRGAA